VIVPIAVLIPVQVPAHTPEIFGGAEGEGGGAPPSPPQETSIRLNRMVATAKQIVPQRSDSPFGTVSTTLFMADLYQLNGVLNIVQSIQHTT
jgi:hypothetical protein